MEIPGLKLIQHNAAGVYNSDDHSLPWKMEANFRPPSFMEVTFISLYGGSEIIIVRGKDKQAIDIFLELNNLKNHSRLRSIKITGPDGFIEEITKT